MTTRAPLRSRRSEVRLLSGVPSCLWNPAGSLIAVNLRNEPPSASPAGIPLAQRERRTGLDAFRWGRLASLTARRRRDRGATKPTYFYGGVDMELFLARLVVTFPAMKRVILAGGSAGGFVRTFGVRVDIIDDSGPPIPNASGVTGGSGVLNLELPQGCPQRKGLRDIHDADRLLHILERDDKNPRVLRTGCAEQVRARRIAVIDL